MYKNIIIGILIIVIIGFVVFTFTRGDSEAQAIIEQISAERDELIESIRITERELANSVSRVGRLQDLLDTTDTRLRNILEDIAKGNAEGKEHISEYGRINQDFRDFLTEYGAKE